MNIWIVCSLFVIAFADSDEGYGNKKDLETNPDNKLGRRPIFPFDAFGLGFNHFFGKSVPFMSAMNKFVPSPEVAKSHSSSSESEKVSDENISFSVSSEAASNSGSISWENAKVHASMSSEAVSNSGSISGENSKVHASMSSEAVSNSGNISDENSKVHASMSSEVVSNSGSISEENAEVNSSVSSKTSSKEASSQSKNSNIENNSGSMQSRTSEEKPAIDEEKYFEGKPDVTNEVSEVSSTIIASVPKSTSSSNEKEVVENASESPDVSSGATVLASNSYEKDESEVETASVSKRKENIKSKSSSVSSDERKFESSSKNKEKESDTESSTRSIPEENDYVNSESISISETFESDFLKSSISRGFSVSKSTSTKSYSKSSSSESSQTMEDAYLNSGTITCDEDQCFADSLAANEPQSDEYKTLEMDKGFVEVSHRLTVADIRRQLEDSYTSLALMKKRLFRNEIVTRDLNQVIAELESLCDKICQELPARHMVSNLQF